MRDVVLSLVMLLMVSPVIVTVALVVLIIDGRPVLFRQARVGLGETVFWLVKFRTMREGCDSRNQLLPDEERLTRLGRFLRSWSLDELPGLWNVVRGDMSLVGPRPLPPIYLPRYDPEQRRRHALKPGLTGWAQINGRNAADWDSRLALDVWYVDHQSMMLDLRILFRTIGVVLRRVGVTAPGSATMPEFRPERGS